MVRKTVSFMLTTYCTLKCVHCSVQVPRQKKEHYKCSELCSDIDAVFSVYSHIDEIRLSGGEAFLHPDFCTVMEYLQQYSKSFDFVTVVTNATYRINHNILEILCKYRKNVIIRVDNYGTHSKSYSDVTSDLDSMGIERDIKKYDGGVQYCGGWFEMNIDFSDMNYSQEELGNVFGRCVGDCPTVWDGKLWGCGFCAAGVYLGKIPDTGYEYNYVDLRAHTHTHTRAASLLGKQAYEGCKHCFGLNADNSRRVPAAEQM